MKKIVLTIAALSSLLSCKQTNEEAQAKLHSPQDTQYFSVSGRTDQRDSSLVMISPASKVTFKNTTEDTIVVYSKTDDPKQHAFWAVAVNGEYKGKTIVEGDTINSLQIPVSKSDTLIEVYKATEASTGNLVLSGIKAKNLAKAPTKPEAKIEFIGNSITSGFGNDNKEYPCDEGGWFDSHNAYYSYATIAANRLDADFVLSSISGWGMYRNWDVPGPTVPDVYDNLYLNEDSSKSYTSKDFNPDLISINLGTNDLSEGDGKHERLPFSEDDYVGAYIKFVQHLIDTRDNPEIAILDSPMVSGGREEILHRCLDSVASYFEGEGKEIHVFDFEPIPETGCGAHPSIEEDKMMADQIVPFYQEILDSKK
ncbi:SGNH/GDSL hydrolase family protein [Zunongwangia endophytica]|uniref:SGNH/GDSL hydrolase family protein n=1 Tax=Zunongwangia endophytica TaxID=1808945 RepID=A0ABV8HCS4_9FLAO|nr:SGNH/GDSL hydrolase family protein [Zunongwangia endophytica]MDN3593514.1 SGNH/GDSL hydrolase family protein [Zunongwangia endophytica]